jgi:hypothetical protein
MKFRPHARAHHNVPIPTSYDQELEVCRPPSHRRNDRMRMPSTAVHGPIPPCGRLCRSHPQGREARRSASAGVSEIRACDQSQNRRGARANCAPNTAGARRRADRVTIRFAALHMSPYGTKRRIAAVRRFGRDWSEADMPRASEAGRSDENDPLRKSGGPKCCDAQTRLFRRCGRL